MDKKKKHNSAWACLIASLAAIGIAGVISMIQATGKTDYSDFINRLTSDTVETVTIKGDTLKYKLYGDKTTYTTKYTNNIEFAKEISEHGTKLDVKTDTVSPDWPIVVYIMSGLLMTTIIVSFISSGGRNETIEERPHEGSNKKKRKIVVDKSTGLSFADVGGNEEAKESLKELIEFLENPSGYTRMGAKLPKGTLLVGPPGTGKTLLAKAVAGEAKVPFIYMAGSDFVEMYVGVGAAKVRRMFEIAEKNAPCIVFIDEIDAIGKKRDSLPGGSGSDEREQTLNQLLSEMDGFNSAQGVVILAATNRPDVLDEAIIRPGRFDRRIIVEKPDYKDRVSILTSYINKIHSDKAIDVEQLAFTTAGCTGADLANIINEAAIKAVKKQKKAVSNEEVFEALDEILSGSCNHSIILSEVEKCIIATHEAAHTLACIALDSESSVNKVSIIPRSKESLGYTLNYRTDERFVAFKDEIITQVKIMLAGYCGEFALFDNVSSSAASDLRSATELVREMVTKYGMSTEYGPVVFDNMSNRPSDAMAFCIDKKVIEIIKYCYMDTMKFIESNADILQDIATELAQKEVLDNYELRRILDGREINVPEFMEYKESPTLFINEEPHAVRNSNVPEKKKEKEQETVQQTKASPAMKQEPKQERSKSEKKPAQSPVRKVPNAEPAKDNGKKDMTIVISDDDMKEMSVEMNIPDEEFQEPIIKIPDDIEVPDIGVETDDSVLEDDNDILPEIPKPKPKTTQKRNSTLSETDKKSKKALENILNINKKPRPKSTKPPKANPAEASDDLTEDDY